MKTGGFKVGVVAVVAFFAICVASVAYAQEGRIEKVTVYRGQAEVIRSVPLPREAGPLEVVVTNLPEQILSDSLYANGPDGIRIRAVRFRAMAVGETPREEIREIDERIKLVEQDQRKNRHDMATMRKKEAFIDRLESFSAPTVDVEMQKGVLDAQAVASLTLFIFEQREEIANRILELSEEERALNEQLDLLRRERAELTRGVSRTLREAVVFLEKDEAGPAEMRLGYLVRGADWTPAYNTRARDGVDSVELEYTASIQQMSGEDWNDVELALSTATPALSSDAPALMPFQIRLGPKSDAAPQPSPVLGRRFQAEQQLQSARDVDARSRAEKMANTAATDYNIYLFRSPAERLDIRTVESPEAVAVTYELPGRQSIKSRADRQTVQIASLNLPAEHFRFCAPQLTRYVYRQAQVVNDSGLALLEGRSNAYLDGRFAGTGSVPLVRPGQRFIVGFGVDSSLTARHRLHNKEERVVGGNMEQTLTYQLLIENFSDSDLGLRVFDRMPLPTDGNVRVSLIDPGLELSDDPVYERFQKPHNILRWDVVAPAGKAEADAFTIEYSIKLEYDRNLEIQPAAIELDSREAMEKLAPIMQRGAF